MLFLKSKSSPLPKITVPEGDQLFLWQNKIATSDQNTVKKKYPFPIQYIVKLSYISKHVSYKNVRLLCIKRKNAEHSMDSPFIGFLRAQKFVQVTL